MITAASPRNLGLHGLQHDSQEHRFGGGGGTGLGVGALWTENTNDSGLARPPAIPSMETMVEGSGRSLEWTFRSTGWPSGMGGKATVSDALWLAARATRGESGHSHMGAQTQGMLVWG